MKRLILTAALLVALTVANAQDLYVAGQNVNEMEAVKTLTVELAVTNLGKMIKCDYGQEYTSLGQWGKAVKITDEKGKKIKLKSKLQIIQHLEERGWELEDSDETRDGGYAISAMIFRRAGS